MRDDTGKTAMAQTKDKNANLEKLSFEQCMEKLSSLVSEMESGNIPLEEMISKFEEGSSIAAVCHRKLADLKQKIEMLQTTKNTPRQKKSEPPEEDDGTTLFENTSF